MEREGGREDVRAVCLRAPRHTLKYPYMRTFYAMLFHQRLDILHSSGVGLVLIAQHERMHHEPLDPVHQSVFAHSNDVCVAGAELSRL